MFNSSPLVNVMIQVNDGQGSVRVEILEIYFNYNCFDNGYNIYEPEFLRI